MYFDAHFPEFRNGLDRSRLYPVGDSEYRYGLLAVREPYRRLRLGCEAGGGRRQGIRKQDPVFLQKRLVSDKIRFLPDRSPHALSGDGNKTCDIDRTAIEIRSYGLSYGMFRQQFQGL